MHTWKHGTGDCLTKRLSVPLPNVCQRVFPDSNTSSKRFRESYHSCLLFYFSIVVHPSCRPVTRGQGGVAVCVWHCVSTEFKCISLCQSVSMRCSLTLVPDEESLFFFFPVWAGWCVNVSIEHAVAALPIARRVNCYTCQRFRSHRLFAFTRCPAALRWSSFLWAYLTTSLGPRWPNTSWEG